MRLMMRWGIARLIAHARKIKLQRIVLAATAGLEAQLGAELIVQD